MPIHTHRPILAPIVLVVSVLLLTGRGPAAQAETPQLQLQQGDRIALVGNSLAERMRRFGNFEATLHLRFPEHQLRVRNFGWPTDEVANRQRPNDYTAIDDPLEVFAPNVLICFYGYNESFDGEQGVDRFESQYREYLSDLRKRFTHDGQPPRLALATPIAYEATDERLMPDGQKENEHLALYTEAVRRVADAEDLPVADLFAPTRQPFAAESGAQYTINGAHINEAGDQLVAQLLDRGLFGGSSGADVDSEQYQQLRQAAVDLQWHHGHDYRMLNGWYVYGGRSKPLDVETFPPEYAKIRKMASDRDKVMWATAQGETPPTPDDKNPSLKPRPTTFGTKPYSEPPELRILSPDEAIEAMTVADGYRVETFADEVRFPELANPVQMNFDSQGRLWAACMPTYPQWKPGDPPPNDRLLIFEDEDGDGQADTVKVFADDLHCPVGFEFFDGGVLVTDQPHMLFLKDTDGDDRADVREVVLDGFASDDTHHAIGAYEYTPDGKLIMLEGVSMSTTVETPWGPFRNHNRSVAYALDPKLWRLERHITPCFANPWCYTNNDWGQGFVGDGTGAQQHWATPLTGEKFEGRRGNQQFINYDGPTMRPALGNGFIYSRHFSESAQGNFYFACVINMNGILQFDVEDHGSGYQGTRVVDLVNSTDANFRPGDPQIGPDGALYFVDWHNPLIGHMQYSQRDPNRDHRHGRIYRLTAEDRPLVEPVTQAGKSISELLAQFRQYEARTRYRARRELRDRDTDEVVAAIDEFTETLDPNDRQRDRLLTECLWVLEAHHAVDQPLLEQLLQAETADARAAAVHAVSNQREWIDGARALIAPMVDDPHPRVRLEAVRALSFFPEFESVQLALGVLKHPMDEELQYTLESTLGALQPIWQERQEELAGNDPNVEIMLLKLTAGENIGRQVQEMMGRLMADADSPAGRSRWIMQLSTLRGSAKPGAKVFQRTCIACHRVGEEGADFGPNLADVGKRLRREEIVEAMIFPSLKIEDKYKATNVVTSDGKAISGLVVEENGEELAIVVADGKVVRIPRDDIEIVQQIDVSSMPERLHESMSGSELADLLTYLYQQQTTPENATPAAE